LYLSYDFFSYDRYDDMETRLNSGYVLKKSGLNFRVEICNPTFILGQEKPAVKCQLFRLIRKWFKGDTNSRV